MSLTFTPDELQQITEWHTEGKAAGNRAAMYLGIAGLLQAKLAGASAADRIVLDQDILWLQGAAQANSESGIYSTLIRTYTSVQAGLRMSESITPQMMQDASNAVGDRLFDSITAPGGAFPTLASIASDDATGVGDTIFRPYIPDDTATTRNAGWSGAVLFSMLGLDQTSLLVSDGSTVQTLDDARNVLFAMYSLAAALKAAYSTGASEAVQYFQSLFDGSAAGPLLTDLTIGFNTATSSSTLDTFLSMAAAFFKNGSLESVAYSFADIGLANVLDMIRSAVDGHATNGTTDDTFSATANSFFTSNFGTLATWGVSLTDVSTLLANALKSGAAHDADRNALSALSTIVVTGIPLTGRNVSLWQPGSSTGLTSGYLTARAEMLEAALLYDKEDHAVGSSIQGNALSGEVYYDLSLSQSPLYSELGRGTGTNITMFGGAQGATLQGLAGNDRLFGGDGADTLSGGAGNNSLEGGAGADLYVIDGSSGGADYITDTDGQGQIEWNFGNSSETLTGGDDQPGTATWRSTDGRITYTEDLGADGRTELEIQSGDRIAYVEDFTNGELGITLNTGPTAPEQDGNLSALRDHGLAGNTGIPGEANYVYTDDIPGALVGSIYGSDSSGSSYGNQINGKGNATYIYAGNGNNAALLGDFGQKATTPLAAPINAVLQGGSGNQSLIGVGNGAETITGGAAGSDTTASTYIDGGGAKALLVGGGQNSIIFGGTGADTLMASSASGSSSSGFNPSTVAMAGISFWGDAYSTQLDQSNNPYQATALPKVNWTETSPDDVQVNLSLYQSDGTFATPFGLLGSSLDSGADAGSAALPGSELVGGTGDDWLIGNSGADTIIGGNPTSTSPGALGEVLVGGAGADLIYGGGGIEMIYADMTPGAVSDWANLDPNHADTIYGGSGVDYIYGSGGNDEIYGGSGTSIIHVGNGNTYVDAGDGQASIYGGSGHDTIVADGATANIQAGSGNAYVEVSSGQTTVNTGTGDDTIEASGGNALVTEGGGQTTLIAGPSTGSDTIQPGSGATVLQLVDGLTESTLVTRNANGDLVLSDPGFDTQITITGYFNQPSGVSVKFEDGTIWGATEIVAASMAARTDGGNDTLVGSNGNDSITAGYGDTSIVGTSGDNTLTGGAGDDTIQGGSGADTIEGGPGTTQILGGTGLETYIYHLGDGADTIHENTSVAGNDTITFGAGIGASDLSFIYDSSTNNALITVTSTGETITVTNFVATQTNQHQIATLDFADGSSLSQLQVIQQAWAIYGTTGNDGLVGNAEANYFDGKGGSDTETGGGGNDTFVFNSGYGHLQIDESYTSGQLPVLQLGTGITASSLHVTSDGTNLLLTDGVSGDQITLDNMWSTSGDGVAIVQVADGTTLTAAQLIQMELAGGTSGNDTLYGTSGADLIDGKGGNDVEIGNGGSDTFVFNAGYGHLEINESYALGQAPILHLGTGITASALRVTTNGTDLLVTDGISGDQVSLDNENVSSTSGVAVVQLADGTTLTASQLIQMSREINGTTGNDTLNGTSGADVIDGKGGNDVANGGGGSDTFVFNAGYGSLEINETYTSGQQPILQLGAGITASALHVTMDEYADNSLVLTDGISGDQVMLVNMWNNNGIGVSEVQLADGTVLTRDQLVQMELANGTPGSDTLYGASGADLIDGKGGNDVAIGNGGNDSFVFNAGYGQLEIEEDYTSGQQPVLLLGAGVSASSLRVTSNGVSLFLTDGITGDKITLDNALSSSTSGVSLVHLADGTILTRDQLLQMEMTGTSGNDSLYGTAGAELFDGKGGADYEVGNGGSDTFVFNAGYGQLEIRETYTTGQQPVLQLGAGITASALTVTTDGSKVMLTDGVSGDQITLDGMWSSGNQGVAVVQLADGTSLTAAQLVQMEMAGTHGNDSIVGTTGAELIDGKGGNDYVNGEGGNDTFVFNAGYGKLSIYELQSIYGSSPNQAVLELGSGIASSALHVTEDDRRDLVLTDGITGDQITIQSPYTGGYPSATAWGATVQFSDGSTLNMSQLQQMASDLNGTTGNDYLIGTTGSDLIDGKGGNDYELGNGGNDTFVYNQGYGALEIAEDTGYTIQVGPGITSSNLQAFVSQDNDVVLTDGTSGDVIRLDDAFNNLYNAGVVVEFSDGTKRSLSQMSNVINGNFYFYNGEETYRLGMYSANRTLYANEGPVNIFYGDGITSADVAVQGSNGYLALTNRFSGSSFRIPGYVDGSGNVSVTFSDGVTWGGAQILQAMETGGPGNDTLSGTSAAELFDGKGGNDSITGYGGSDTFVFKPGYGHLEINETYTSGQQPVLQLGTGIAASALQVTASGANLVLTDGISGDQITLDGQNGSNSEGVALVQFADGTSLTAAQLVEISQEIGGTSGSDTLTGTAGADWFDGKGGNDSVTGNGGSDTFVYNAGYGDLAINEAYASGQQPILRLGAGITVPALVVTASGANLVLTDGISGDQITLDNQNASANTGVALVQFADGTTWTGALLAELPAEIRGTTGSDTVTGTSGADLIDGKGGNDYAIGNGGSDTFFFNSGYGHLEINETYASGEQPMLQLGAGITASSLQVAVIGANVVLTDGISGDQITLDNQNSSGSDGVALVAFANGTTLTAEQLSQMSVDFIGTTGNDLLTGNSGDDLIDGKGGNDTAVGGGGNDTFIFNAGYADLEINESYLAGQQPVLQLGTGINASAVRVTSDGISLFLTDGISGDRITLDNMLSTSTDGVAAVKLADGTTFTRSQLLQMEMTGTTGGDTLYGTSAADLIDGKGGNDSVVGGGGNDTFVFNSGYGDLEINESYKSGQAPLLQLGPGITASALHVIKSGNNIVLTDGVGGDQITLDSMWTTATNGIASLKFSDGTTLTRAQIIALEMTGTTGNDTITGTSGADLIDGKGGNDSVVGGGGNDTFVFNSGYGDLEINEVFRSGQTPVLQLGAGIAASALHATKSGNNLVLTDGITGDQITLDGMWTTATDGVSSMQLSDGTTLTRSQIIALEMIGTSGGDTITGTSGADLIDGKGGNDSVVGSGGNDTFVFNSGYGHLEINEVYNSGQTPLLQLGSGITAAALNVTTNGTNVVIADGVTGDQVTLDKMWSVVTDGVASLHLSDGTTLTRAQIIALEMTGTTGNDTITGTSGADLIDGKGGNDSITGNGGNDTFVFNSGYGHLTINETYTSGQTPVLQMGAGITTSTLKVAKSGNNLVLTDGVTGDQITLTNMSLSSTAGVATVKLANGTSLTRSQLIGMEAAAVKTAAASAPAIMDGTKVNTLIHAIASYTGNGSAGIATSVVAPPVTPDLMLHSAA